MYVCYLLSPLLGLNSFPDTVLQPNYTGSLGFGEAAVRALPGNCGKLDVEDSIATLRELIKQGKASDDRRKLFYTGGSHGGFIGGHSDFMNSSEL